MSNESSMKKCGYCGQTAHTSTACNNGKVDIINLFGVRIDPTADQREDDGKMPVVNGASSSIHESKSMEGLKIYNNEHRCIDLGYSSDGHNQDKNKGMPWMEDEHRSFLTGLQKLGKGQWQAISKHYVPSRTPTQVASHAQKFFIRMNSTEDKRKLRSSLFDMPLDEYMHFPLMNYTLAHPLNQRTESFATLVPQPLLITNGETCSTQEPEVESTND